MGGDGRERSGKEGGESVEVGGMLEGKVSSEGGEGMGEWEGVGRRRGEEERGREREEGRRPRSERG